MTPEQAAILVLSERIIKAQEPIRILDSIKWRDDVKEEFFKHKCQKLPKVDQSYYKNYPLTFKPDEKIQEFEQIIRDTKSQLGQYTVITSLIEKRCLEYIKAITMLKARGTNDFSILSKELYGSPEDAFYPGGPKLSELGDRLGEILPNLSVTLRTDSDEKIRC